MYPYSPYNLMRIISSRLRPKVILCLATAILPMIFLLGEKAYTYQNQDQDQKYNNNLQLLPDQSFAVIEKKPDGALVRLLPHHDAMGKVIVPWLEDSMGQIFQLDPNHRAQAREHLLKDYYEKE